MRAECVERRQIAATLLSWLNGSKREGLLQTIAVGDHLQTPANDLIDRIAPGTECRIEPEALPARGAARYAAYRKGDRLPDLGTRRLTIHTRTRRLWA